MNLEGSGYREVLLKIEMNIPFFLLLMSLEALLSKRIPSSRLLLHPPSVDRAWNIKNAHYLISHACHIMTLVEKGKYTKLSFYLEKKESYLELLKELDELADKYNVLIDKSTCEDEYKDDSGQMICYYAEQLEYANKLLELDETWNYINHMD